MDSVATTPIAQAVAAAFDEAKKQGKVFDGQKIGMRLRETMPKTLGGVVTDKAEAEKIGREAVSAP